MKKKVAISLDPPISWEKAKSITILRHCSIVYGTKGGSLDIDTLYCEKDDLTFISSKLRDKKISFKIK